MHTLRDRKIDLDIIQSEPLVFCARNEFADLLEHELAYLVDSAAFFRGGNKYLRRDEAMLLVKQSEQSLRGDELPRAYGIDRLIVDLEFAALESAFDYLVDIVLDNEQARVVHVRGEHYLTAVMGLFVEVLPERHKRLEALDLFGTARKHYVRRQVDVETVDVRAHFQLVHQHICRCFGFFALTVAEHHTETPSVKEVQVGSCVQTFIHIAYSFGYLVKYIGHHIVTQHTRERVVIADIQHYDIEMLVIVERALHIVRVGGVFIQSRERVDIVLGAEHARAHDKQRHCYRKALHQIIGDKEMYQNRYHAQHRHREQRENFPTVEQHPVSENIHDIQNYIWDNADVQRMEQYLVRIAVLNRKHKVSERIGNEQYEIHTVRQRKQNDLRGGAEYLMPGIGKTYNEQHMYKRVDIVDHKITRMREIKQEVVLTVIIVESHGEDVERCGYYGDKYLQKEQAVGGPLCHLADNDGHKQHRKHDQRRGVKRNALHMTTTPLLGITGIINKNLIQ